MDLSKEIIQQFIDVTTQDKKVQNGVTLYGTIKTQGSEKFVILDGSDQLTPIKATTFVSDGERVTVMIKNHQAVVTGNITSPAARQPDVEDTVGDKIAEYDVIITKTIEAQDAKIGDLVAQNVEITGDLTAVNGSIEQLKSENVEITGKLNANEAEIKKLKTDKLDAETADIKFATVEELKATNIEVNTIKGNHADFADLTAQKFEAVDANIKNLEVDKLSASEADLKYANIDFANIGKAAIEHLFAQSGLIKDLVVGDQHITGELVGVTIKGDLIEGGTIVADKLVVKGSDGLYYKLNTDGMKVEAEQTEYNSLNGSIITAKSITATKVNVDDLVAFDATIGGFKITDNSIHSGVKSSVDNTTRGIYLDNTGQVVFGDGNSFLKYFKDSDGKWKLVVSANSVKLSTSNTTVEDALDDMNNKIDNTTKSIEEHFAVSNDPTTVPTSGWTITPPVWQNGKYIWSKMITTYVDGRISESKPVCITGATGQGIQSITEEYYLSTSKTSQSGGSWVTTPPTWSTGKYMWTRSKIVYKNPTSTAYTTPVCDSSWEAVNEVQVGGRNLAQRTSNSYSSAYTNFTGVANTCSNLGKVLTDGLSVGDTITIRLVYKYTNIVATTGQTAKCWIQGSGNVTSWNSGTFSSSSAKNLSGSGEFEFLNSFKITAEHLKNTYWDTQIRHDYVKSGSVQWKLYKVEKGNKATDWSPAPEDIEQRVSTTELELKPDKILQKVNTQIGAGGKIDTVSTILDKDGFTVKNGALKVQNKAGQNVLVGDTNGNLWIQNTVKVGGGTNGAIEMFNAKSSRVGLINQTGVYLNDGLFNVTSGAIIQTGIGSYPRGIEKKTVVNSDKMICKEVEQSGSQTYTYEGEHGTFETRLTTDFLGSATGVYNQTRLSSDRLTIYHGEGTSDFDKGVKTIIDSENVNTTNVEARKINCTSMIKTLGFDCSQGISIKNTNYQAADSQYIKMSRSNGYNGAVISSGDNGLGLRLHTYNNTGAWSSFYMFRENGWFSTPALEVRGTRIEIGKEGDNSAFVAFYDTTKTRRGYVGKGGNSSNNIYLYSESSDGNITINSGNNYVHVKGHLSPLWDNTYYLGVTSPGYRWKQLCATTTSIATSDSRYKKNIKPIVDDNNIMLLRESSLFNMEPPDSNQAVIRDYHEFIKNRFQPYSYEYLTEDDELDDKQGFKLVDKERMAKSIGFIADEYDLENDRVAKEFIFRTEDGILNYNTGNYTTVIAIALQEEIRLRDEQIKVLTDSIEEKDKKINDLEKRLSKLESLINNIINKEE